MENDLYKIRSLGSCLKAAYDLFGTNMRHIFRRTWLPALLFAVFNSVAYIILTKLGSTLQAATATSSSVTAVAATAAVAIVLGLLTYAAYTWLYTIIISLLNGESVKRNLPRIIRLMVLTLCIAILLGIVFSIASLVPVAGAKSLEAVAAAARTTYIIIGVVTLVCIVVFLPLSYSMMKYSIETNLKLFSVFKKPYIAGWKHWGYLFMISLLAGIIVTIVYLISSLPMTVTTLSYEMDSMGQAMGDASGLPGYFYILAFLAGAISSFIMAYAMIWFTIVIYYTYGHIEAKEKAKTEIAEADKAEEQKEPDFEEIK